MEKKIDKISEDIHCIRTTLAEHSIYLEQNTKDLKHHIKRTDLLEDALQDFRTAIKVVAWVGGGLVGLLGFGKIVVDVVTAISKL